jgi:hypothetical protein
VPSGGLEPGQSITVTAALENLDATRLVTALSTTLTGPEGWTIVPAPDQPVMIEGGDSASAGWTVTAPGRPTSAAPQTFTATVDYVYLGTSFTTTRTFTLAPAG